MLLLDIWYAAVIHPIENIVISRIHKVKPEEIETALKANRPRMIIANVEFIASPEVRLVVRHQLWQSAFGERCSSGL